MWQLGQSDETASMSSDASCSQARLFVGSGEEVPDWLTCLKQPLAAEHGGKPYFDRYSARRRGAPVRTPGLRPGACAAAAPANTAATSAASAMALANRGPAHTRARGSFACSSRESNTGPPSSSAAQVAT